MTAKEKAEQIVGWCRSTENINNWHLNKMAEQIVEAILEEREACASVCVGRGQYHKEHCKPECRCADPWHLAYAIRVRD